MKEHCTYRHPLPRLRDRKRSTWHHAVVAILQAPHYRASPPHSGTTTPVAPILRTPEISPYLNSKGKRVLDVSVALLLIIVLTPLLLITSVLICGTSNGSALFRQLRNGQHCKPFVIYKFRSMYIKDCNDPSVPQATRFDPRVTPIGRWIRKTSIDELPQLINVLSGEMSLVGPRPHALVHDSYFITVVPFYLERFEGRPGITGLAQINGERGETPNAARMQARLAYDLDYIRRASLMLDLRILVTTIREMIFSSSSW